MVKAKVSSSQTLKHSKHGVAVGDMGRKETLFIAVPLFVTNTAESCLLSADLRKSTSSASFLLG